MVEETNRYYQQYLYTSGNVLVSVEVLRLTPQGEKRITQSVDHQRNNRQQLSGNYKCVKTLRFFFSSHGNVNKQTNPLQVDDLITNKSLAIFEALRRILDTQYQHSCSCKCENITTLWYHTVLLGQIEERVAFPVGDNWRLNNRDVTKSSPFNSGFIPSRYFPLSMF